jgi:hypothetical protein
MNRYPYNVQFEDKKGKEITRLVEADNPGQAFQRALKKFKVKRLIKCWLHRRSPSGEFYVEYDPPKNWDMLHPKPKKSKDVQAELELFSFAKATEDKILRGRETEAE